MINNFTINDNAPRDCAHCVRNDHCWSLGVCNLAHCYKEQYDILLQKKDKVNDAYYSKLSKDKASVERFALNWIFSRLYRSRRLINSPIKCCAMIARAVQDAEKMGRFNVANFVVRNGNLANLGFYALFEIPVKFLKGNPETRWSKKKQREFIDWLIERRA